jgi:hypothetical protein
MKAIKFVLGVGFVVVTIYLMMFVQQAFVLAALVAGISELSAKIIGFAVMMFLGAMILWGDTVFTWITAPFVNKRTKTEVVQDMRRLIDEIEVMDRV